MLQSELICKPAELVFDFQYPRLPCFFRRGLSGVGKKCTIVIVVGKEMNGELPVELGLRFPSTIHSGDICPGSGIEALSDLTVVLHHVQQLEYQVLGPPGFVSCQLLSY